MNVAQVVAVFASGVALATSIGSLAVSVIALRRDRSHIKVETSLAIAPWTSEDLIDIRAINDGRHTETVTSIGFHTADRKQLIVIQPSYFLSGQLPRRLEPNESNAALMPLPDLYRQCLKEGLRISHAFARTQSGRLYRDRPFQSIMSALPDQAALKREKEVP